MNPIEPVETDETYEFAEYYEPTPKRKETRWEQIGGGALTFSVLLSAVMLVVLALWYFTLPGKPAKEHPDFIPPGGGGGERSATSINTKRMKMITPSTNVKRVIAEGAMTTFTIPDQGDDVAVMSPLASLSGGSLGGMGGSGNGTGWGKGNGSGTGIGDGGGVGKLFGPVTGVLGGRCSKDDRLARIKQNGGTALCEDAVVKGLQWLKANQQADGSWNGQSKTAMTGLALLAYFGHCESPASREFGVSCLNGIMYLVNLGMKNDGKMADNFTDNSWVYQHAIATYALAEATVFCKEFKQEVPYLQEVAQKAGQWIIDNQNGNGGWAYAYVMEGGHTDVSIVGWQLQALKACYHTGLKYRGMSRSVDDGLKFIAERQNPNGGYGYADANTQHADYFTLTGVGMLSHQMWGKGSNSGVKRAAKYVMENSRFDYNGECCDLYGHYYESQAMMQMGGEYWKKYNDLFRDQLLNNQNPDGSWKVPGGGKKIRGVAPSYTSDTVYRTCLCTLMLEVYYRFLSTGGGGGTRGLRGI